MREIIRISAYWKIQIIGWFITSLYWSFTAYIKGVFVLEIGIVDLLLDMIIGIAVTHCYRNFVLRKRWNELNLKKILPRIVIAIILVALIYAAISICKLFFVRFFIGENTIEYFLVFFKSKWLQVFITGIRLITIWVLAYHLYHYSRREIKSVKENARLSLIAKEAQLHNLNAQLNPHFLFNTLNTIKFLVSESPDTARRSIDLLAHLLRNSLDNEKKKLIPLYQEMNLVNDYLELEKLRFEERLNVIVEICNKLKNIEVLPLSIHTLVENAIKHGVSKSKTITFVKIKVEQEKDNVKIEVSNSGKLASQIDKGVGLENLKERLNLHYKKSVFFEIKEHTNNTVLAIMIIPIN